MYHFLTHTTFADLQTVIVEPVAGMQAISAACTGAAIAAAGTYQMYHAVWKSRDHIAEVCSVYRVQVDPTGRQVRLRAAYALFLCAVARAHAARRPSRLPWISRRPSGYTMK
jgi:hypothetical protein